MPDRDLIAAAADPSLADAGRVAIRTCLSAGPDDVVTIATDEAGRTVAACLLGAALETGCDTRAFLLERHGSRPLPKLPAEILSAAAGSTVTALCVTPLPGEWRARAQLIKIVQEKGIRHAHLINVTPEAMRAGMCADYPAIDRLQDRLLAMLEPDATLHLTSPAGTDCRVTLDPAHRWVKANGLIRPGRWQNLPSGEIFTCPATVDGTYVVDRGITDWFEHKYGDLAACPVMIRFAGGRVRDVRSDNANLARDLMLYVHSNENGDRAGEIGIGTNPWLAAARGTASFADKLPGAHFSLGDPLRADTGATWTSQTRVSIVGAVATVAVGGATILREGTFAPGLLDSDARRV